MTSRNNQSGGMLYFLLNSVVRKVMSRTIEVEGELWRRQNEELAKKKATELTRLANENLNAFLAQMKLKLGKKREESEESEVIIPPTITEELTKLANDNLKAFIVQMQTKLGKKHEESEEIISPIITEELTKAGLGEDDIVIHGPRKSGRTKRKNYADVAYGFNIVNSPGEQPKTLTQEQKEKLAADLEAAFGVTFTPDQIRQMTFNEPPPSTRGGKKRKTNKKRKLKRRKTRRKH